MAATYRLAPALFQWRPYCVGRREEGEKYKDLERPSAAAEAAAGRVTEAIGACVCEEK